MSTLGVDRVRQSLARRPPIRLFQTALPVAHRAPTLPQLHSRRPRAQTQTSCRHRFSNPNRCRNNFSGKIYFINRKVERISGNGEESTSLVIINIDDSSNRTAIV